MLKKENWFIDLFFIIITGGLYFFVLARRLDLYKPEAWYADYRYWLVAILCFFFPVFILFVIFLVQIICSVAHKLHVPGEEIYGYPYAWILCLILPIVGWTLLLVMGIYIVAWSCVMIAQGEGENICKASIQ